MSFHHFLQWNICQARSSFVAQAELYVGKNPRLAGRRRPTSETKKKLPVRQHFTPIHLRSRLGSRLFCAITCTLTSFLKPTGLFVIECFAILTFVTNKYTRCFFLSRGLYLGRQTSKIHLISPNLCFPYFNFLGRGPVKKKHYIY